MRQNLKNFLILNSETGQALLIVVLVMLVSLTVGLAVVSRSITTLRNSNEEANSERAFSAAEAGIEYALKTGVTPAIADYSFGENSSFNTSIVPMSGDSFLVNGGNAVSKDDALDIWLVEHNSDADSTVNYNSGWQLLTGDSPLTIYWGPAADTCVSDITNTAAIEIIAVTGSKNSPVSTRYAVDPCSSRILSNHFSPATLGSYDISGKTFSYAYQINILNASKGLLVRVIPFYASTPISVTGCALGVAPGSPGCNALPSQGRKIESTGKSGGTQRKVVYYQGYPKLPTEFFQYIKLVP